MRQLTYGSLFSGVECMSAAAIGLPLVPRFFAEVEPFPCAVLRSKFPGVPNLGDVTKIKYDSERKTLTNGYGTAVDLRDGLDVLAGGSPCFVAGTLVLTPSGYRPIEELKVGDEVVGGKTGEIRRVEAVGSKVAPVGRIKVLGRPPITCTHDHKFSCVKMRCDNRRSSDTYSRLVADGDYSYVRADEAVGLYAGRVKHCSLSVPHETPAVYSCSHDDVMALAGYYLGDGYIRHFTATKKSVVLALVSPRKIDEFKSRFGGKVNFSVGKDGKVVICCSALALWLIDNFGEGATEKRVPYWVYSDIGRDALLGGYLATDGCAQGRNRKFLTVSQKLALGIADLIGYASVSKQAVPPTCEIEGRTVRQHDTYTIQWPHIHVRTKYINGRYASKVRSYEDAGTSARVFNITVSDEHAYVVGGLWVKNCQDFSVAGKRAGADSELLNDGGTTRSSLIFTYIRLLREIRPKWIIYENVPGLLTSNEGRDFAHFLVALAQCGYGDFAWRVLDAQYVRVDGMERAVPQRRRRVWLVGHLGENHRRSAEVLLEPYGDPGDLPPRRKTWEEVAGSLVQRPGLHGRMVEGRWLPVGDGHGRKGGMTGFRAGAFGKFVPDAVSGTLDCDHMTRAANGTPCLVVEPSSDGGVRGQVLSTVENHKSASRVKETDVAPTIGATRNLGVDNDNPLVVEKTSDCSRSVCYDGYNQRVYDEVCMTVRSAATGTDGNDADPKVCVSRAYGMNPKNGSQMVPCSEEVSQTLAVEHTAGVVAPTRSNCWNPADPQSKRVFREDGVADTLPAMEGGGRNNQAVMLERKSTCLTPGDPLQKRVYTADGAAPTLLSIAKNSGVSAQAFVTKSDTEGDEPLPEIVVRRLTPFECESLMGLPQGWTVPSFTEEQIADPDLISHFRRVHDDWQRMNAGDGKTPKPKTEAFVRDWLARISDPATCPDAPRFKACGNGWAVNCPRWILLNLLRAEGIDPWYAEDGVADDAAAGKGVE